MLRPGVEIVLEATNFTELIKSAQLVVTGEGRTDFQTVFGKAPVGIAKIAQKHQVPTICIAGCLGEGHEGVLKAGIDGLMSITTGPMTLESCMQNGKELITQAAARACQMIQIGMKIKQHE